MKEFCIYDVCKRLKNILYINWRETNNELHKQNKTKQALAKVGTQEAQQAANHQTHSYYILRSHRKSIATAYRCHGDEVFGSGELSSRT